MKNDIWKMSLFFSRHPTPDTVVVNFQATLSEMSQSAKALTHAEENAELKERVRAFWQAHPCGTKFSDAEMGTREFFQRVEEHRFEKEWHIPEAAGFARTSGLRVL